LIWYPWNSERADFVDRYSFMMLEYEKVLGDCLPLVFWAHDT